MMKLYFWIIGFITGLWVSMILISREISTNGSFNNIMPTEKIFVGIILIVCLSILAILKALKE